MADELSRRLDDDVSGLTPELDTVAAESSMPDPAMLSPFAGSVTEQARRTGRLSFACSTLGGRKRPSLEPERQRRRRQADGCGKSMSSAPVETLGIRRPSLTSLAPMLPRSRWGRWALRVLEAMKPRSAAGNVTVEGMVFLAMLGVTAAVFAFALDLGIEGVTLLRWRIFRAASGAAAGGGGWLLGAMAWVGTTLLLCWLAIALTKRVAPDAAGSGIPEMKSILAGSPSLTYLSRRTLLAKAVGLILGLGAGLPLGKEGPCVHISCCVVNSMFRMRCFGAIRRSKPLRLQMLAVGCAVGVSSTFGAPIGGVLFSIEVTATYFLVPLYWRCFFAATVSAIVARFLNSWWHSDKSGSELDISSMMHASDVSAEPSQMAAYVLIGVLCGASGVLFVNLNTQWNQLRRRHAGSWLFRNRFAWSMLLISCWACVSFPRAPWVGSYMSKGQLQAVDELFSSDHLSADWHDSEGDDDSIA